MSVPDAAVAVIVPALVSMTTTAELSCTSLPKASLSCTVTVAVSGGAAPTSIVVGLTVIVDVSRLAAPAVNWIGIVAGSTAAPATRAAIGKSTHACSEVSSSVATPFSSVVAVAFDADAPFTPAGSSKVTTSPSTRLSVASRTVTFAV